MNHIDVAPGFPGHGFALILETGEERVYDRSEERGSRSGEEVQRPRRWTAAEDFATVRATYEAGVSEALVTCRRGVNRNQIFRWSKLISDCTPA